MESILMAIKYSLFIGLAVIVLAVVVIISIAALYQGMRNWIRAIRKGPFPQHKSWYPFIILEDWHDENKTRTGMPGRV